LAEEAGNMLYNCGLLGITNQHQKNHGETSFVIESKSMMNHFSSQKIKKNDSSYPETQWSSFVKKPLVKNP
jgi:hypothetical protein